MVNNDTKEDDHDDEFDVDVADFIEIKSLDDDVVIVSQRG